MVAEWIVTEDLTALAARSAQWISAAIREASASGKRCTLALSGGSTVRSVYAGLAELPGISWRSVSIFFGDERAVPPDHPESNYRLARETLLSRVSLATAQVHRMEAERPDREQAAWDYEALLPDPLDILLLGMGSDGHTASLFPHAATLAETVRRVVPALGGIPFLPRLTITPPVIEHARRLLMMVSGAEKATSVARALSGPLDPSELPAQLARHGSWILDRGAASELGSAAR
jgi:6-phosphogluconolactonase